MLKNAIAYILRKRSRTVIIFIILTIVLSCLYSCLNIMKSTINLENNLYKLSNTSLSITQNNNENFKTNQFKEIENIKEIKETIPQYDGLAKSTNIKAVEGMQMIERDDMPEEFRNIFSIEATNNTGKDNLFNSGIFTLIKGRHIEKDDREKIIIHEELAQKNNLELNNIELDNTGVNTPDTVGVDANTQQTQGDKSAWDIYTKKTHVIGRTVSIITLVMLVGAPFLIGKLLGAYPDLGAAGKGFLSVGIVWLVSSIAEFLIYTPMLGAGGGYQAFITGNLINMKIPCAVNARDMVGAKTGTPENEIISTISIATSSLVTILVLALGVLLMVPLQPVLQSEVLQPAFENVVPALFGAMAYKYYRKNMKIAALPLILMSLLFILVPSLIGSTSFMIVPSGAIAIGVAYLLFRKKNTQNPEQTKADPNSVNTGDE